MFSAFTRLSLVTRIVIAIILGVLVAVVTPQYAPYLTILGDLFIKALKSVAPNSRICSGFVFYCEL